MNAELVMNLETIMVALIVSVIAPGVLALITNRRLRMEKKADYERQDEVAARVARVAALQLASTQKVALVAETTASKLEQVHILVNSNITVLMQAELAGLMRETVLLDTMKEMNVSSKAKADPKLKDLRKVADARIVELNNALAERAKQTQLADAAARV